jgi:hypothetical protein
MKVLFFSFSIAIIALFFTLTPTTTAQQESIFTKAKTISGDDFPYSGKTPRGVRFYAVSRPSRKMLQAIDKGFADLFDVARRNGYGKKLKFKEYTVFIARPDRLQSPDGSYSPDIAVGAAQYAGTVYDKGGFIYAAGIVVSNALCAFLIPEYTRDFDAASKVVRFEGEHILLFHNDRQKYNQTADHSRGGGHPILR